MWQLSQYLQDALYREQMLENKLANLQRLLSDSQAAAEENNQVKKLCMTGFACTLKVFEF